MSECGVGGGVGTHLGHFALFIAVGGVESQGDGFDARVVGHVGGGLGSDFLLTDGKVIDLDFHLGGAGGVFIFAAAREEQDGHERNSGDYFEKIFHN